MSIETAITAAPILAREALSKCAGKKAMGPFEAHTFAKRVKVLEAYRCPFCREWHVGSRHLRTAWR